MSFYTTLLERLVLPLGDILLGTRFIIALKKARNYDSFSNKNLIEKQRENLRNILVFATKQSKYYKSLDIPEDNDPFEWLSRFPLLEKDHLKKNGDKLMTCSKKGLVVQKSSGSSGIQTTVYWKPFEWSEIQAFQTHWWEWAGYKLGSPLLQTGITLKRGVIKRLKDILTRTYYLPAFILEKSDLLQALAKHKNRNAFLGGYASSLYLIAQFAMKEGQETKFASAISWGDKLFPHYKSAIENAFKCKTFETYGTSEGFMIAAQKDLEYLYINTPQVYFEILDDKAKPLPDGRLGNVIVTNLVNTAMPLIRYKIGDLAIKLPLNKYPEKREYAYPLIEKVIGRDTDIVKTKSGKSLVVHTFTGIFEHYPLINQFRVIQENLEKIVIEYISENRDIKETLSRIKSEILNKTNTWGELEIIFRKVNFIPPTKSGKPQIIESKLIYD